MKEEVYIKQICKNLTERNLLHSHGSLQKGYTYSDDTLTRIAGAEEDELFCILAMSRNRQITDNWETFSYAVLNRAWESKSVLNLHDFDTPVLRLKKNVYVCFDADKGFSLCESPDGTNVYRQQRVSMKALIGFIKDVDFKMHSEHVMYGTRLNIIRTHCIMITCILLDLAHDYITLELMKDNRGAIECFLTVVFNNYILRANTTYDVEIDDIYKTFIPERIAKEKWFYVDNTRIGNIIWANRCIANIGYDSNVIQVRIHIDGEDKLCTFDIEKLILETVSQRNVKDYHAYISVLIHGLLACLGIVIRDGDVEVDSTLVHVSPIGDNNCYNENGISDLIISDSVSKLLLVESEETLDEKIECSYDEELEKQLRDIQKKLIPDVRKSQYVADLYNAIDSYITWSKQATGDVSKKEVDGPLGKMSLLETIGLVNKGK